MKMNWDRVGARMERVTKMGIEGEIRGKAVNK